MTNPTNLSPEMLLVTNVLLACIRQRDDNLERTEHDLTYYRDRLGETQQLLDAHDHNLRLSEDALEQAKGLAHTRLQTILTVQKKLDQSNQRFAHMDSDMTGTLRVLQEIKTERDQLRMANTVLSRQISGEAASPVPAEVTPELGCPVCGAGGMWLVNDALMDDWNSNVPPVDPVVGAADDLPPAKPANPTTPIDFS